MADSDSAVVITTGNSEGDDVRRTKTQKATTIAADRWTRTISKSLFRLFSAAKKCKLFFWTLRLDVANAATHVTNSDQPQAVSTLTSACELLGQQGRARCGGQSQGGVSLSPQNASFYVIQSILRTSRSVLLQLPA